MELFQNALNIGLKGKISLRKVLVVIFNNWQLKFKTRENVYLIVTVQSQALSIKAPAPSIGTGVIR